MRFSEETLMAYADGELDAEMRSAVEAQMADNADLADAVALQIENRHALQAKLRAAFDGALSEELPPRLLSAARAEPVSSASEPATSTAASGETPRSTRSRWSWLHWTVIVASLVIGLLVGSFVLQRERDPFVVERGRMQARAELDTALSMQSGGAIDRETGIQIGVSYLAKNGDYCRTFTLRDAQVLAGLACRRSSQWWIDALTATKADASGTYRMANANVPALILGLVEDTIAGDPLDGEQEVEARERGWQR